MKLRPKKKHQEEIKKLESKLKNNDKRIKVKKKTISNLFRYGKRNIQDALLVDLTNFDGVISVNTEEKVLNVQGLATFEQIVEHTLPEKLLPIPALIIM